MLAGRRIRLKIPHPFAMRRAIADSGLGAFMAAWRRDPLGIGAVVPSSPVLARAIARKVAPQGRGTIIELGPGSGAITAALIESGVPRHRLYLVERDAALAAFLRERYEGVRVVEGDARHLKALVRRDGVTDVAAVISGIPLRNLDVRARCAILMHALDLLTPAGVLVQFTYSQLSPLPRALGRRLGVVARRAEYIWLNVPPAWIWLFRPVVAKGARPRWQPPASSVPPPR